MLNVTEIGRTPAHLHAAVDSMIRPWVTPARAPLNPMIASMTGFLKIAELWSDALNGGPASTGFDRILERLQIQVACADSDVDRIPAFGPILVVANHPHGLLGGLVLGSVLGRRRPDFRFLLNEALAKFPGIQDFAIPVDVFGGSAQLKAVAALSSMRWLRRGGVLVAFPAGEVSAISGVPGPVTDRKWSDGIVRIAASTGAQIVRIFISGRNSVPFNWPDSRIRPWGQSCSNGNY